MNEKRSKPLFFFIGTEAELIKVFPVIIEARKKGLETHIIASGQNDLNKSCIIEQTDCGNIDIELSKESDIKKTAAGLFKWWAKTYSTGFRKLIDYYGKAVLSTGLMIVHGDTVSTYMGARLGKKLGMTVCHVEAGLRSHHLFNPFPEEIDRLLTSRIARVHFAPGDEAVENLSHAKGRVVNTLQNTLLDSLRISESFPAEGIVKRISESKKKYFVFVMHRQENLAKKDFVCDVVDRIEKLSEKCMAIVVGHKITVNSFKKYDLIKRLKENPNVKIIPRTEYFDFMKLLKGAEFVITDGGSNQEELYYMGKPTLILRKSTERREGLGKNAHLYNNVDDILQFAGTEYTRRDLYPMEEEKDSPTRIIVKGFKGIYE